MPIHLATGPSTRVIVDGQAHSQEGLVMVEAGGRDALGTTSHELTHIIIHRATFNPRAQNMPSWLGEGLAEFGNLHATVGYDLALEFAVQNDRVLPIMFMRGQPSKARTSSSSTARRGASSAGYIDRSAPTS